MLLSIVTTQELDVGGLGKVLAQEVGGACLNRLAILHHRLDAVSRDGTRKALALTLLAADHWDGEEVAGKGLIDPKHLDRLLHGFLLGLMGRMPFLPEELRGPEEKSGTKLPADDVGPLVEKDR